MSLVKRIILIIALISAGWLTAATVRADVVPIAAPAGEQADAVFIDKSERRLELLREGKVIRSYKIALGGNPIGPKRRQGDQRTPEGEYRIDYRNAQSSYHLSLHINYPNATDRAESAKLGVRTGGDIFIHGLPNSYPLETAPKVDWTLGCIALDNAEIKEIWQLVPNGTPINIVP